MQQAVFRFHLARASRRFGLLVLLAMCGPAGVHSAVAGPLRAGTAKVDITNDDAGPVNDRLYAKALVVKSDAETVVLVTIDAVAIGEIGPINNDYLPAVRAALQAELGIDPRQLLINASHCHGVVCADIAQRTIAAVKQAHAKLVPVRVGTGRGQEDRISENRRLLLKSGRTVDVRHAYSLPPDEEVAGVGPIDPEIGLLRLDRVDGGTLAVVYNFACHPIQGVPGGGNTADLVGYASQVIEENLAPDTLALFLQGCGGDINPVFYKDVDHPRSAEPLGKQLGLSTLRGVREIECHDDDRLTIRSQTIALPRGDRTERIAQLEADQRRLLASLTGTSLNFKTFVPLYVKYSVSGEFPSYYSHRYLQEQAIGRDDQHQLDAENRRNMAAYLKNVQTMEELTRLQTNLALLKKHQAQFIAAGSRTIDVEIGALRIGDFVLATFPGELTVEIGLRLKAKATHPSTFVAGYTNGYIYYCPTAEQMQNVGFAQEDSDCLLAPEWQAQFEAAIQPLLDGL
ncbi:MAG: hypothetical protein ACK5Q5_03225 [Planctomycetaceae bacterium]